MILVALKPKPNKSHWCITKVWAGLLFAKFSDVVLEGEYHLLVRTNFTRGFSCGCMTFAGNTACWGYAFFLECLICLLGWLVSGVLQMS